MNTPEATTPESPAAKPQDTVAPGKSSIAGTAADGVLAFGGRFFWLKDIPKDLKDAILGPQSQSNPGSPLQNNA